MRDVRYQLTRLAQQDLEQTWIDVSERFGIETGDRVLDALIGAFEMLATHPGIGHHRQEIADKSWRFWVVGPSLIVYRGDLKPVQIARILRGERDWEGILRGP